MLKRSTAEQMKLIEKFIKEETDFKNVNLILEKGNKLIITAAREDKN